MVLKEYFKLSRIKSVRLTRSMVLIFTVVLVLLIIPVFVRSPYLLHILILVMLYGTLAECWNIIAGYAGLFSFGHHAFFGLGAYTSALLAINLKVSPWIGLLLGGIVASATGLFISYPCLKLKGAPYIAITTLTFAEVIRLTCSNLVDITRGELGLWGIPTFPDIIIPGVGSITFSAVNRIPYYYLMLIIYLMILYIFYKKIIKSHIGLGFRAMRDSEEAAQSLGINLTKFKLLAFGVSAFFAGLLGSFYAHYISIITPTSVLSMGISADIIAMTIVGGIGTFVGPLIGSFFIIALLEYFRFMELYRFLIYGATYVVVMLLMPGGIIGFLKGKYIKKISKFLLK